MNCDFFRQEGVVSAIDDNNISISISVCSGCHASGNCAMKHSSERIIQAAQNPKYKELKIGSKVLVSVDKKFGIKSIYYCYIIPFFVLITSLVAGYSVLENELLSVILSILALVGYYFFLYFYSKTKANNPNFIIEIL
ncbi:MAG: SoxR reducing system RseC family protein [Alphaproteobacteria bacterium]